MPPNNPEAMTHYRDTIRQRASFERVARYLTPEQSKRLRQVFGHRPMAVWGSRDTPANRAKFEKMNVGDDILIVEGATVRLLGKVALKAVSADLSRELWHNILDRRESAGWDLIYFIANPLELGVPFAEFCRLFGYDVTYQLRGFTIVSEARLEAFYRRYDDLYSILVRIRAGQTIESRQPGDADPVSPTAETTAAEREPVSSAAESDHVRMRRILARLGHKAGNQVWVPRADQQRVLESTDDLAFEQEFVTGIDLPKTYVENIDVVWKDEYRIDAAFEVENSTAIYSGLLRFADLRILAPNTTYPMFIVAPAERRNRVREQLKRPVFRQLELREKVRFLPYETIDDIDRFFATSSGGLSAELIAAKAETLIDEKTKECEEAWPRK